MAIVLYIEIKDSASLFDKATISGVNVFSVFIIAIYITSMDKQSDFKFSPLSASERNLFLLVKAKPGKSHACAPRIIPIQFGRNALEISVSAAPEGGRANKAIIEFLAKEFGLKKSNFSIKSGLSSRLKVIEISAENHTLLISKINEWLAELNN